MCTPSLVKAQSPLACGERDRHASRIQGKRGVGKSYGCKTCHRQSIIVQELHQRTTGVQLHSIFASLNG